ncbi:MAG: hypothetical protein KC620_07090 [Myxococcales bacterium]|nr:hypothetical protein [Myxococcales bacterium]
MIRWALWACVGALCAACAVDEVGEPPPDDALYFPVGIAAHPDGRYLYITNAVFDRRYNAGTLMVYDTAERRVLPEATKRIGLFAGELVIGQPGGAVRGFTVTRDTYKSESVTSRLLQVDINAAAGDAADHLTIGTVDSFAGRTFETNPYGLSLTGEDLVVTHADRGVLSRWSVADTGLPVFRCSVNLANGATAVARHPVLGWWYVSDRFEREVQVVAEFPRLLRSPDVGGLVNAQDCQLSPQRAVTVYPYDGGGRTRGLAFSADGSLLYVANSSEGALRIFDTTVRGSGTPRNALIASIPLGGTPDTVRVAGCRPGECAGIAPDSVEALGGGLVYVTLFDDDRVVVVDPTTLSPVARIETGQGPHDLAFMLDAGGTLRGYATLFNDHALAVFDLDPRSTSRFTLTATVP